jgi:hypothetical protein
VRKEHIRNTGFLEKRALPRHGCSFPYPGGKKLISVAKHTIRYVVGMVGDDYTEQCSGGWLGCGFVCTFCLMPWKLMGYLDRL